MVWVIDNLVELAGNLVDVATADPLSAVLVAVGTLLLGGSSVAFGVLALRALLDPLVPETTGRVHGRAGR